MDEKQNDGLSEEVCLDNVEESSDTNGVPSRRNFIKVTAAGAVAAIVSASCNSTPDDKPTGTDGDDDDDDNDDNNNDNDNDNNNDDNNNDDDNNDDDNNNDDTGDDDDDDTGDDDDDDTGDDDDDDDTGDDDDDDTGDDDDDDTGSDGTDGDDDDDTGEEEDPPTHRVVRVINPAATTWDGQNPDAFYQYTVGSVVDEMVEAGLKSVTNRSTLEAAWQSILPNYQDNELVVIHINAYANNDNSKKNNVAAPLSALVYGLVDILGIPAGNIAIVDPSKSSNFVNSASQARIVDDCRYKDEIKWGLYGVESSNTVIASTSGNEFQSTQYLARVMDEADHVIMAPVLSWHSGNWITGAMKMMVGSMSAMGDMHRSSSNGEMRENGYLADICKMFSDKVRLVMSDGLYGNIWGNNSSPHAFETLGGGGNKPSSCLYFSRDMVALDCVMFDDLIDEAKAEGDDHSGYKNGFLKVAAGDQHQLGTFEMRDDTGADSYSVIDFINIDQKG